LAILHSLINVESHMYRILHCFSPIRSRRLFLFLGIAFILRALSVQAQEDDSFLFADDNESAEETNEAIPFQAPIQVLWSGSIDFRLIHAGKARRWQDGGPSLTRYGGVHSYEKKDRASTQFQLSQASLVSEVVLQGSLGASLQINYDDSYDGGQTNGKLGIVEAMIHYDRSLNAKQKISVRMGRLIPPISMEHPETAWNTRYTITPSAINSWVGEELRPNAIEVNYRKDYGSFSHFELMLAPFSGNDSSGSILAWRGWAMHDYQATLGSRIRFSGNTPESIAPTGRWGEPFKEIDGQLGLYSKISWVPNPQLKLAGFYSNSGADHTIKDAKNEYPWLTEFTNISVSFLPFSHWIVMSQRMGGSTRMGDPASLGVINDFSAFYILSSYLLNKHRFTIRYDSFDVVDKDKHADDLNDSNGTAITLAYLFQYSEFHTLALEALNITSERKNNGIYPKDPDDNLYQLMYRLLF